MGPARLSMEPFSHDLLIFYHDGSYHGVGGGEPHPFPCKGEGHFHKESIIHGYFGELEMRLLLI